jgi:hypothetical protein
MGNGVMALGPKPPRPSSTLPDRRFAAPSKPRQLTEGHEKRPIPSLVLAATAESDPTKLPCGIACRAGATLRRSDCVTFDIMDPLPRNRGAVLPLLVADAAVVAAAQIGRLGAIAYN